MICRGSTVGDLGVAFDPAAAIVRRTEEGVAALMPQAVLAKVRQVLRQGGRVRFVQFGRPLGGGAWQAVVAGGGVTAPLPLDELRRVSAQVDNMPEPAALQKMAAITVSEAQRSQERAQATRGDGKRVASNDKSAAKDPRRVTLADDIIDEAGKAAAGAADQFGKLARYAKVAGVVVGGYLLLRVFADLGVGVGGRG